MEERLPVEPLQGVSSPFAAFPQITSAYDVVSVLFTVIFILWAIYTAIAIYHWIRYGHHSWVMVPAIALHLLVSAALMLFTTLGFS